MTTTPTPPYGYVLISKAFLQSLIGDERMAEIDAMCQYPINANKEK